MVLRLRTITGMPLKFCKVSLWLKWQILKSVLEIHDFWKIFEKNSVIQKKKYEMENSETQNSKIQKKNDIPVPVCLIKPR